MAPLSDEQFETQSRAAFAHALRTVPGRVLCGVAALLAGGFVLAGAWELGLALAGRGEADWLFVALCLGLGGPVHRVAWNCGFAAATGRTERLAEEIVPGGTQRVGSLRL